MESPEFTIPSPQKANRTLRLIFEYEGNNVRLVSQQRVRMIPPATSVPRPEVGQAGFWYELRDRQDRSIYQRVVPNPIRFDTEVFTDDPKESVRRQEVQEPRGTFFLLVPELPEAASVVLFSTPLQPRAMARAANELARFDLIRDAEE